MTDYETIKRLEPELLPPPDLHAHARPAHKIHLQPLPVNVRLDPRLTSAATVEEYLDSIDQLLHGDGSVRPAHGMPTDPAARKGIPVFSGLLKYFPHACAAVAQLSRIGNDQHNPGEPLHWAKDKSTDEPDCIARHMVDFAVDPQHRDPDGVLAAVKIAWRALANLERLHDAGHDIFATEP